MPFATAPTRCALYCRSSTATSTRPSSALPPCRCGLTSTTSPSEGLSPAPILRTSTAWPFLFSGLCLVRLLDTRRGHGRLHDRHDLLQDQANAVGVAAEIMRPVARGGAHVDACALLATGHADCDVFIEAEDQRAVGDLDETGAAGANVRRFLMHNLHLQPLDRLRGKPEHFFRRAVDLDGLDVGI